MLSSMYIKLFTNAEANRLVGAHLELTDFYAGQPPGTHGFVLSKRRIGVGQYEVETHWDVASCPPNAPFLTGVSRKHFQMMMRVLPAEHTCPVRFDVAIRRPSSPRVKRTRLWIVRQQGTTTSRLARVSGAPTFAVTSQDEHPSPR